MHVLRRPRLPQVVEVSLVAALLAVLITLVLVSALGPGIRSASGLASVAHRSPAAGLPALSRWLTHPLAPLPHRPAPSPWIAAARGR